MAEKVLVVGRSGSGKTTSVNTIAQYAQLEQIPFRRFKDYQILYDMYEQDIEQDYVDDKQRKFRSTEYGGFDVLKYFVFDDALKILEHKITDALRLNNDGIITIEFARNNYQHALKLFNPEFLRDAHVLFISCELEVCIQRIYERIRNGPRPDFHYVSDRIMRSYFSEDNIDYMAYFDEDALGYEGQHYKTDFPFLENAKSIDNTNLSLEAFQKEVECFASLVRQSYFDKYLVAR